MNSRDWKEAILSVLTATAEGDFGRAGATPVSRLADQLAVLQSAPLEAIAAADAIVSLIEEPIESATKHGEADYWRRLSYLSQYIPVDDKRRLASAFRARLFGANALDDHLKRHALNALVATSAKLTPKELQQLASLRESGSVEWLNAAICSRRFRLAFDAAKDLLARGIVDINVFIVSLDDWHQRWDAAESGVPSDFGDVVAAFEAAAYRDEAKTKLANWRRRRGFEQSSPAGGSQLLSPKTISQFHDSPSYWKTSRELTNV